MKPTWRKSSHSDEGTGSCVELTQLPGKVGVRDSKDKQGPNLDFPRERLRALLDDVKSGRHDL